LIARATDNWGNTATAATVNFIVDNTAPAILIEGISEGAFYNSDVTPTITITDTNLADFTITLDGRPYVSGIPITTEGSHTLIVVANDAAANTSRTMVGFTIDKTPPVISVTGVQDQAFYNNVVTPVITVAEINPASESITLNGLAYVSGEPVAAENTYLLAVTATDAAGNQASFIANFEIDLTPPVVTIAEPQEGATFSAETIAVSGNTEPFASLFLTRGSYTGTTLADVNGAFSFAGVSLVQGENLISVYAVDRAGNTGEVATVTVRRETIKLNGQIIDTGRVLVWLPHATDDKHDDDHDKPHKQSDDHDSGKDGKHDYKWHADLLAAEKKLSDLLTSVLVAKQSDFVIVHDADEFRTAMRSRRYTTMVLAELHPAGNCKGDDHDDDHKGQDKRYKKNESAECDKDHDDDHYSSLKIEDDLEREIKATVASGVGLVWMKSHPDHDEHWEDVFGAEPKGRLHRLEQLVLPDSPASAAGTWALSGDGIRLKVKGGTAVGELMPKGSPAVVIHRYGDGPTALVAFNPGDIADQVAAQQVVNRLLEFAVPSKGRLLPGAVAETRWTASKIAPTVTLQFEETLPDSMSYVRTWSGEVIGSRTAKWERTVDTTETSFRALVRLPVQKGEYLIQGKIGRLKNNFLYPLTEQELTISLEEDQQSLVVDVMDSLIGLAVSHEHQEKIQKAIEYIQEATTRAQTTQKDVEYSIHKLNKAYHQLDKTDSINMGVLVNLGRLIGTYQIEWALRENAK